MLERHLQENPMSTVFDLEDEPIQINRFANGLSTDKSKIFYLELDSRIDELSPEQLKDCLASEYNIQR